MKKFTTTAMNRLHSVVLCLIFLVMISLPGYSQNAAINTTMAPANASAGLDIDFPAKGFLIPRVSLVSSSSYAPLTAHVAGMVLYNTSASSDVTPGIYFDDGAKWVAGPKAGTSQGDMQYWNGTAWAPVSGGIAGQYLTVGGGGAPVWSGNGSGYVTLSTSLVSAIAATTATCGGSITNDGGTAVIARGVCWSTSPDPTVALPTKTSDGSGSGIFSSSITGLVTGTTYYIRAYGTNNLGTVYGSQVTFTTN